ncbi:hypothetical protein MKK63_26680 [Methylobacterium sp. J-088]|uniref:hypothetical protein n=1 Tax=Methylobacterium sp. J-088 TaxID=2836664 RepID=UPI001FBB8793|nr:hypothetical protein [Methylobacterium sp. J-088]MCJ2066254.1 hypothetical protein [Methylobacterium sp. J-088]
MMAAPSSIRTPDIGIVAPPSVAEDGGGRFVQFSRASYPTGMSVAFAYRFQQDVPRSSLRDLDDVVLLVDVMSDDGDLFPAGRAGTIVSVHGEGESYIVEFAEPPGALVSVFPHEIRRVERPIL